MIKNVKPGQLKDRVFCCPVMKQQKEVNMKLILAVLSIRMLAQLFTAKQSGKRKTNQSTDAAKVQHPAAFELR